MEPIDASGPSPRSAVRAELARTLAGLAWLPLQTIDFAFRRSELIEELRSSLEAPAAIDAAPQPTLSNSKRLCVFVSCAEASGEIHAANLVREIRRECARQGAPAPRFIGLGGQTMASLGVEILGDPVARAVMGLHGIRKALPYYLDLLETCAASFRSERPDVVAMVDSPALHVPLAAIAKRYRLRTLHFVTPQHWAWAPWRTAKYARVIDLALTILPFEPAWFARRGVHTAHVGHPLLDALAEVPTTHAPEARRIVVLPGSRARVIDLNLPWMLETLARLRERVTDLEVAVLQSSEEHRFRIEEHVAGANASSWAHVEIGDVHRSLARATVGFSVSGTVLLDLLHHRLPMVAIYRVRSRREVAIYRNALSTPYFASINLLAGREVVPEFCFRGDGPRAEVVAALERLLSDPRARRDVQRGFETAAVRLGPSGACRRAALHALELASRGAP